MFWYLQIKVLSVDFFLWPFYRRWLLVLAMQFGISTWREFILNSKESDQYCNAKSAGLCKCTKPSSQGNIPWFWSYGCRRLLGLWPRKLDAKNVLTEGRSFPEQKRVEDSCRPRNSSMSGWNNLLRIQTIHRIPVPPGTMRFSSEPPWAGLEKWSGLKIVLYSLWQKKQGVAPNRKTKWSNHGRCDQSLAEPFDQKHWRGIFVTRFWYIPRA